MGLTQASHTQGAPDLLGKTFLPVGRNSQSSKPYFCIQLVFHKCCFTEMLSSPSRESIRAKGSIGHDKFLMFRAVIRRGCPGTEPANDPQLAFMSKGYPSWCKSC